MHGTPHSTKYAVLIKDGTGVPKLLNEMRLSTDPHLLLKSNFNDLESPQHVYRMFRIGLMTHGLYILFCMGVVFSL